MVKQETGLVNFPDKKESGHAYVGLHLYNEELKKIFLKYKCFFATYSRMTFTFELAKCHFAEWTKKLSFHTGVPDKNHNSDSFIQAFNHLHFYKAGKSCHQRKPETLPTGCKRPAKQPVSGSGGPARYGNTQEYIQDPAVSEALQAAHEDFEYSCFQPSWGEKGRQLFPYSLHLGEYSSNQVSDNVEDLQLAMKEYVEWMNAHFAVKWKHSCAECHVVDSKGQEYSAAVMDGKVMGHLLCRVIGCNLDIIGINTKFCINHAGLKWKCIISGCANQKGECENSFDYQPQVCKEAKHMEAVQKFFSDPSTTIEKTAKKYGGKTGVSVGHVKDDERNYEEFGFCYSSFDRFLPGVFLVVWSCGHIMDIGKICSFESNKFITGFLCQTFMRLEEYPTFMFYDKACVFVRTLKNGAQQNKLLHK
ncbi:hypothetical protein BDR26DRAFT_943374 [Obelidium mucronatum]|nr:hypothetical protein BDR26DRAFT_943374 [Obelidium mucronatum]